jgi:hypothetical protein
MQTAAYGCEHAAVQLVLMEKPAVDVGPKFLEDVADPIVEELCGP